MEETTTPLAPIIPTEEPKKINKKLLLIIAGILLLFTIISIVLIIFLMRNTNKPATPDVAPTPTPITSQSTIPAPKFSARTYTYAGTFPETPQLNIYELKSNFTQEEVASFAAGLGLENITQADENRLIYGSSEVVTTNGMLSFNTKTGTFSYKSFGSFIPSTYTNQAPTQETTQFLESLGIIDPTVSCNVTYQDKATPDVTYVECHRMWDKLNAPLLNLGGVLNIPENILISSLTPGKATIPTSPSNPDITNVSNGGNGLARPNEFNTITVGIFPDGRIHSINSTMRILKETRAVDSDELISSGEAVEYFKQNIQGLSLTIPAGYGNVDWEKVYPNNEAVTDIAAISEIVPAYLDKPLDNIQNSYEPYYLIRGTARLESGYTIQFTQALPAIKSKLAAIQPVANEKSIQIETFTISPQASFTQPSGTASHPSFTPAPTGPPTYTACQVLSGESGVIFNLQVPGYGNLSVITANKGSKGDTFRTYSFVTDKVYTASQEFNAIRAAFFKAVEEQYVILAAQALLPEYEVPKGANNPFTGPTKNNEDIFGRIQNAVVNPGGGSMIDCTKRHLATGADNGEGSCFQTQTAQDVADRVKARVRTMQSNPALLASTASQPNLFPNQTIGAMNWVFEYSPVRGSVNNLPNDYNNSNNEQIACYISGSSPHVFIHAISQNVEIKSDAKITFSDPRLVNNSWKGKVTNNNFTSSDNVTRSSIYYEYDPASVNFTESKEGFIVAKNNLTKTIQYMADSMGLTKTESQAFKSDILNEASKLPNSKYIKLSFIENDELDKQLPLALSPIPHTFTRIHIMVKAVNSSVATQQPEIKKVTRDDYSVLELGAYAQKD